MSLRRGVVQLVEPVIAHTFSDSSGVALHLSCACEGYIRGTTTFARQPTQACRNSVNSTVPWCFCHASSVGEQKRMGHFSLALSNAPPTLATVPRNRNAHVESTCGFNPQAQIGQSQNCCHATALPSSYLASAFRKADQGSGFCGLGNCACMSFVLICNSERLIDNLSAS